MIMLVPCPDTCRHYYAASTTLEAIRFPPPPLGHAESRSRVSAVLDGRRCAVAVLIRRNGSGKLQFNRAGAGLSSLRWKLWWVNIRNGGNCLWGFRSNTRHAKTAPRGIVRTPPGGQCQPRVLFWCLSKELSLCSDRREVAGCGANCVN